LKINGQCESIIIPQIALKNRDLANYNRFSRQIAIQELRVCSADLGHMMPVGIVGVRQFKGFAV
jgi:hypothetical protein